MKIALLLLSLLALGLSAIFGSESADEIRKKVEARDAVTQFNLGLKYYDCTGVQKDSAEAVNWYRKSAEQGDADCQFNPVEMYDNGDGVPKDSAQAHACFSIAGAKGNESAKKIRAIIEKEITREQIS